DTRYARVFGVRVLLESEDFVVVDKPYYQDSHDVRIDGPVDRSQTIEHVLQTILGCKLHLVHQLDFATSGVHMWARNARAAGDACKAFRKRWTRKEYVAVVKGHVANDRHLPPPFPDPAPPTLSRALQTPPPSQQSYHRTLTRRVPVTHVALTPLTGRRHQLRVHLASKGHPIIGDWNYEDPRTPEAPRMMLHARHLSVPMGRRGVVEVETGDPFEGWVVDSWEDDGGLGSRNVQ
ncbi:pseudouridine synthase, partial [Cladochytrium replicatum]